MRTGDSTEDVAVDDRLLTRVEPRGRHRRVDPDAVEGPDALPQMFVRGVDRAAYQLQWDGSVVVASNLEGICTSGATAAYMSPSHLDVFCRETDSALDHRVWDRSTGWTAGWSRVGGIATSDPDTTSPGPEYPTDVFVRGSDAAALAPVERAAWMTYALGGICTSDRRPPTAVPTVWMSSAGGRTSPFTIAPGAATSDGRPGGHASEPGPLGPGGDIARTGPPSAGLRPRNGSADLSVPVGQHGLGHRRLGRDVTAATIMSPDT